MTDFDVAGRWPRMMSATVDRLAERGVRGDGMTVPGVFATWERMGEVIKTYIGGGNSLANAFGFDRTAGESAAREFALAMTREEADA